MQVKNEKIMQVEKHQNICAFKKYKNVNAMQCNACQEKYIIFIEVQMRLHANKIH